MKAINVIIAHSLQKNQNSSLNGTGSKPDVYTGSSVSTRGKVPVSSAVSDSRCLRENRQASGPEIQQIKGLFFTTAGNCAKGEYSGVVAGVSINQSINQAEFFRVA